MDERPEELQLDEAVSRVYCRVDAASPPVVTREEVRCILEGLRFQTSADGYAAPRAATTPSLWDEQEAVVACLDLKCKRAATLIASSSAGQSTQAQLVYEHLLREREREQPYEVG